jgi:hypothetical protein
MSSLFHYLPDIKNTIQLKNNIIVYILRWVNKQATNILLPPNNQCFTMIKSLISG